MEETTKKIIKEKFGQDNSFKCGKYRKFGLYYTKLCIDADTTNNIKNIKLKYYFNYDKYKNIKINELKRKHDSIQKENELRELIAYNKTKNKRIKKVHFEK